MNYVHGETWLDELNLPPSHRNLMHAILYRLDRLEEASRISSVPTTGRAERPSELLTVNPDWTLERCLREVISVYSKLHQLPLEDLVINHHMYSSTLHLTWRQPTPSTLATEEAGASGPVRPEEVASQNLHGHDWAAPQGWNDVPPAR